jgi:hypothetical protein
MITSVLQHDYDMDSRNVLDSKYWTRHAMKLAMPGTA